MKITFRLNQLDTHAHFTVFVNGANAGDLVMRDYEYREWTYFIEQARAVSNTKFTFRDVRGELDKQLAKE